MAMFISRSPAETQALAEGCGRTVHAGAVIALSGELGAGKTEFVKGLARGLGIPQRVHSPTFALINIYEGGRLPVYHLDLFRLETLEQISAAGLEEYLSLGGVTVIEWPERWFGSRRGLAPARSTTLTQVKPGVDLTWVEIQVLGSTERRIIYEYPGA